MTGYFTRAGRLLVRGAPIDRIMARVEVSAAGCWLWTGTDNGHGYGSIPVKGRRLYVHRISYEHFIGPIPDGHELDHLCDRERCVNPTHLEPVTPPEHARRQAARRRTCRRGHPYDEVNTYRRPDGKGRQCRACQRITAARNAPTERRKRRETAAGEGS